MAMQHYFMSDSKERIRKGTFRDSEIIEQNNNFVQFRGEDTAHHGKIAPEAVLAV